MTKGNGELRVPLNVPIIGSRPKRGEIQVQAEPGSVTIIAGETTLRLGVPDAAQLTYMLTQAIANASRTLGYAQGAGHAAGQDNIHKET